MKSNSPRFVHPYESKGTKQDVTGRLPYEIPIIRWYDDSTFHKNILGKNMWDILGQKKKNKSITKCDRLQVNKYCGFSVKQNRDKGSK